MKRENREGKGLFLISERKSLFAAARANYSPRPRFIFPFHTSREGPDERKRGVRSVYWRIPRSERRASLEAQLPADVVQVALEPRDGLLVLRMERFEPRAQVGHLAAEIVG